MANLAESIGNVFLSTFETLGVDPEMAKRGSQSYSSAYSWIDSQTAQAAVVGGTASAIPGIHHAGVFVDMAAVIHKMAIMTWGVGFMKGCTVDARLDLANVLALWSGAVPEDVLGLAAELGASPSFPNRTRLPDPAQSP